jgi:hypothetical protein
MHKKLITVIVLMLVCFTGHSQRNQERNDYVRNELFRGELTFSQNGTNRNVPLVVEDFIIDGGQKIPDIDFAFEGVLIIQLRGGELIVFEDNREVEKNVTDVWIVPPDTPLQITTSDDSAILRIYLIGKEYLDIRRQKEIVLQTQKQNTRYKELVENLFVKEVYQLGDPDNPMVRIMDINVGPGLSTKSTVLSGAAQIQVISGGSEAIINGKQLKGPGASLTIPEGESLTVDNREGKKAVKLRAVLFLK